MKPRITAVLLGGALLAAAATWAWRTYQHARLDLVTLHVREAPLPEVLRRLEAQTGERILADAATASNARVQLDVDAVPLPVVLGQLADQTGAFWRTIDAVYASDSAPRQLALALRDGIPPGQAGWTNLSASPGGPPDEDLEQWTGAGPEPAPGPEMLEEARRPGKRMMVMRFEAGGPPGADGQPSHRMIPPGPPGNGTFDVDVVRPAPPGLDASAPPPLITGRVIGVGPDGSRIEFDASPVWVLLEGSLAPRLPAEARRIATSAGGAPRLAEVVKGRWMRLYSLERSPIPGLRTEMPSFTEATDDPSRTPVHDRPGMSDPGDPLSGAVAHIRRRQFERLEQLTPEQRARQPLRGPSPSMPPEQP